MQITKSLTIGVAIDSFGTFGVTIQNPNATVITYAINGGSPLNLAAGATKELPGVTNLNELAFTGVGTVYCLCNVGSNALRVITHAAITGLVQMGATLTVDPGDLSETPTETIYQWKRNGQVIDGQTASTYVLTAADENKYVSCDLHFDTSTGQANDSAYVKCGSFVPEGTAVIAGTLTAGQTLSVTKTFTNNPTYTYKWYNNAVQVATTATWVAVAGSVYCKVTATNAAGSIEVQTATVTVV